ncbi:hypothetical protein HQO12_19360 [Rhodococcus fascians]|uniref:hypothetical protein n=1 Tax=Rhodococcoides fascians TaxID=1828 RepID=UPI00195F60D9|nr:hypothetical protein [Rhodococcus fascians]MBM7245182.1 hypothetical protein [Rhodococcus fascians]MBY3811069.1 hypothetical protein [Rhodococcus fascians]MBY3842572.1 hypothetical protein [Rhodococcus fascians]MBY3845481.1 hypothetical protein [Rhodococcus fascians]MBY3851787.1 hypothetical protein [Rhodococcus fascians]
MTGMNKLELKKNWASVGSRARQFIEIYPYISILRGCHIEQEYIPTDELSHSFALTQAGDEILSYIEREIPDIDAASARLAVAVSLAHNEIFVDVEKTDTTSVRRALDGDIKNGSIRFPQEYGRLLYDRFFDLFPTVTRELTYEQTQVLVGGTPTAAYQMGTLTVGPLGAVPGNSFRIFPPRHSAPLWHCSDFGCSALHSVKLGVAPSMVNRAIAGIRRRFEALRTPPSEWGLLFGALSGEQRGFYRESPMPKIQYLLADGFTEDELGSILKAAFELSPHDTRTSLSSALDTQNSAESIIEKLTEHGILQCLLLLGDQLLGQSIEAAILSKNVVIPVTEKRHAYAFIPGGSWWDLKPEVGSLGLRSVSPKSDFPMVRLLNLLNYIGTNSGGTNIVEWELRFAEGNTLAEKLSHTIQNTPLDIVLRRFVLANLKTLQMTVDYLQPMHFVQPTNEAEESALLDRILWKLGFALEQHPLDLRTFWDRTSVMTGAIDGRSGRLSAPERDTVRSAAVNYFVSLEELLDQAICFTGWALFHNHYSSPKPFCFSLRDARKFTVSMLHSAGSQSPLNPNGQNTLSPLALNIRFLADYMEEIATPDAAAADLRATTNLPEFYVAGAASFPFAHNTPLYDLQSTSVARIVAILRKVATDLARIDMPNFRNRLEHRRPDEEFPEVDEITVAISTIGESINSLEAAGLIPVLRVYETETHDTYGRIRTELSDYSGRRVEISGPTGSRFGKLPALRTSQILMICSKLQTIPDILRFKLIEESHYKEKWSNYPKRRIRISDSSSDDSRLATSNSSEPSS